MLEELNQQWDASAVLPPRTARNESDPLQLFNNVLEWLIPKLGVFAQIVQSKLLLTAQPPSTTGYLGSFCHLLNLVSLRLNHPAIAFAAP